MQSEKIPAPPQVKIRSLCGPTQEGPDLDAERESAERVRKRIEEAPRFAAEPTWDTERKRVSPGFRHQGRNVLRGEVIELDIGDARMLVAMDKAEIVETYYGQSIRSASMTMEKPAVARLTTPFKKPKRPIKFSRTNIYTRDQYCCAYCGKQFPGEELTYDHVVPKTYGGQTTWENIITSCSACNTLKGGRTPEEAGMPLLRKPSKPTSIPHSRLRLTKDASPLKWHGYIY